MSGGIIAILAGRAVRRSLNAKRGQRRDNESARISDMNYRVLRAEMMQDQLNAHSCISGSWRVRWDEDRYRFRFSLVYKDSSGEGYICVDKDDPLSDVPSFCENEHYRSHKSVDKNYTLMCDVLDEFRNIILGDQLDESTGGAG